MLDLEILDRLQRLIKTETSDRDKSLNKEISRLKRKLQIAGNLQSGYCLQSIQSMCAEEITARISIFLDCIIRTHNALGNPPTENYATDIKEQGSLYVEQVTEDVEKVMSDAMKFMETDAHRYNLSDAKQRAIERMDIEVDLYVDSLNSGLKSKGIVEASSNTIFISHATEDAALAMEIKNQIDSVFQEEIDVFVSSIPGKIPPGTDWLVEIIGKLTSNSAFVVLVTPFSENRQFVWFEIGFSWLRRLNNECEIYAICAPPINPGKLAEPLRRLQSISLNNEAQTKAFFESLTKQFKQGNSNAFNFANIKDSLPDYALQIKQTDYIDAITLTAEANALLQEAANDGNGYIMKTVTMGATTIQTHFKNMIPSQDPRVIVKWEHALNELIENDLIEDKGVKGECYKVTKSGYEYVDILKKEADGPQVGVSANTPASELHNGLEFDKASGTHYSTEDRNRYCTKCLYSSSKRVPLKEQTNGWRCSVCNGFYTNPNYTRPTHAKNDYNPLTYGL